MLEEAIRVIEEQSSDSEAESEVSKVEQGSDESEWSERYIPRRKLAAYQTLNGKALRTRQSNPSLFTRGTNPEEKDLLKFVLGE